MSIRGLSRGAALSALTLSVGFAGLGPVAPPGGAAPAPVESARRLPSSLMMAVDAVGGAEGLRGLESFTYSAESERSILDEGVVPGDGSRPVATVESRVRYALRGGGNPARFRIDAVRTSLGTDRPVHEVASGRSGYIRGVDANFSPAVTKPMTSDRWAAIGAELRLLNPHLLLSRALDHPKMARNGGQKRLGGRLYRVLVIRDAVAPIKMFIDARTGRLARLRTLQHDYLRRDVPIEVMYKRWVSAGDGVMFPSRVSLSSDGFAMIKEKRSKVRANPTLARRLFKLPSGLAAAPFDAALARIGAKTSQWLMSFANFGFIKDGGQTAINPITLTDGTTTAQGVTLLGGVANNSLVIQRPTGVVVFEGALHDMRAEAVIKFIEDSPAFTGPITHVVTTHHHADHAGGMRPYVALGATAVVGQSAVAFFQKVFAERDSTILPDRLDGSDVAATVEGVPAGGLTLTRAGLPIGVRVFPIQTTHSTDMVVPYLVDQGVLFTSDIYSPPGLPDPADPNAQAIVALVRAQGLTPKWIAGGHGGFISYAAFAAAMGA